jgi:HlyD family secretion protein
MEIGTHGVRASRFGALLAAGLLGLATGCVLDEGPLAVGTVERDRLALAAERMEPIVAIEVTEGQRVAPGDVLVRLLPDRVQAEVEQADAQVRQAQRRLDELLRGPRQEAIDEARARLSAAESALRTAQHELERIERLRVGNLTSEAELENSQNARDQARGEVDAERAALAALVDGTTIEELDQARAALQQAQATARHHRVDLDRLTITSPREAVVEALPFELGETPAAAQPVVVLRAIDRAPFARVHLPAALRQRLAIGDVVNVSVDGYGTFAGRVRFIASEADFTPYYALTERDAGRLSYRSEIDLSGAERVPSGVPARIEPIDE